MAKVLQGCRRRAQDVQGQSNVQDWNQATNMVITGKAGGQIMGDWAQGEFQVAGQVAGKDYTCLPGLGVNADHLAPAATPSTSRCSRMRRSPRRRTVLASVMLSPETQVAFNLKKGSLPVRGDVDLAAANDCMKKGLEILRQGQRDPGHRPADQPRTPDSQIEDLLTEFFSDIRA